MLPRQARVLRRNAVPRRAVAARARRHARGLQSRAPDLLRARYTRLVARHVGARRLLLLEVRPDIHHVLGREARGHALHDGARTRAGLERRQLRGDVPAVLAREDRVGGERAVAVGSMACGADRGRDLLAARKVGLRGGGLRLCGEGACVD